VGIIDGEFDGFVLGLFEGDLVVDKVGVCVGSKLGVVVSDSETEGSCVGSKLGAAVGDRETDGDFVGS